MRDQFLDDFTESFKYGMVVNRGEVEIDRGIFDTMIREFVLDALHYISLDIKLVVIRKAVYFVNENFNVDVWVGRLEVENGVI